MGNLKEYSKEIKETAANLRIIDDALFRLMGEKPGVCEEILRTLLDMPHLQVVKVSVQSVVQSFQREITLDALCMTQDGRYCNVEVQKGNSNDDIRRTRFHAAALTAKYTPKGADFKNVPDVTIVYISEYDVLKNNQTVTHVTRCMKNDESYVPVKDGEDIIHFLRREMLDFTAFPVFFVSNLLLVQRKKYYFNRAMVSRNCSIVL